MHVVLEPGLSVNHNYRVVLPNKRAIEFGRVGIENYTTHGNPKLMRAHLLGKGAIIPEKLQIETDLGEIHRGMLMVDECVYEDWDDYFSVEFWERWLLWSYPNINHAKLWMTMRKGVLFMPVAEDLWFSRNNM